MRWCGKAPPGPPKQTPCDKSVYNTVAYQGGKERGSWLLPAMLVQEMDVDRLEALADAEEEDADDDQRHEDREGDADLHHQRHALGARRGEDQAVLDRHEA